jgi:hypothetical protein
LREVERVLVPDGRVVISGFNPDQSVGNAPAACQAVCPFGLAKMIFTGAKWIFWPLGVCAIGLRLLSFDIEQGGFGAVPALGSIRQMVAALTLGWTKRVTAGGLFWDQCIFWWLLKGFVACISSVRNGKKSRANPRRVSVATANSQKKQP